ncbi:cation-binding protein [Francisella sp. SYW-9]|uniref:cation-binding protein n=1 Tax=Francisella sp. SYW-9 TaxID=2610888 RepID=UPI00123C86D0|nr:cation-binding protein [Francisella sp. SYW-9]
MNLYIIIAFIFIFLIISTIAILLAFNIKNTRRFVTKFKLNIRSSMRLNRSLRQLLSQADRKTRKSFRTDTIFFIHINTSNTKIIENETSKSLGIELYKNESLNYNHYLSDKSYILELHKFNDNHAYKELSKFCHKVSSITGKTPIFVYSFEYSKIKDESLIIDDIKSLRSIIIQLTKVYKKIPNFVLTIADIEKHPGYQAFIECVATHNIPLLSPFFDPNNLSSDINNHLKKMSLLAENIIFKKHPKEFLRFSYFINDIYKQFKQLLKNKSYLDANNAIQHISLYINNTKPSINQNLFQNSFNKPQKYKTRSFKNILWTITGVLLAILGLIFTKNIFVYKDIIKQYKQDLFAISDNASNVRETIKLSNDYEKYIASSLSAKAIYSKSTLNHGIYLTEGLKIQQQILDILEDEGLSKDNVYKTFIYLTLIAPQNSDLKWLIKSNLHLWSLATKLSERTINIYINAPVPAVKIDISNTNINKLIFKNLFIKSRTYDMVKSYIIENNNINLKTLNIFLENINLPITKQRLINKFMKKIYPQVKDSFSPYNRGFLEKLYEKTKNTTKSSSEIQDIKNLIPTEKETQVNNLQAAIDLLDNLNNDFHKHDSKVDPIWHKIITQAVYNDLMNNLALSRAMFMDEGLSKQSVVNVGDNASYYGNISIIYTKIGLKDAVLPEISEYKSVCKSLGKQNINTLVINNYYNDALDNYIKDYKKSYINLIASYKNSMDPNDLVASLYLVSSTSSQFNNMLKTLSSNTVFDKKTLKEIPQLDLVRSYFQNVNKMISNPNDMDEYNQIIRDIANQINQADYKRAAINKITLNLFTKSKDSYFYKVNALLKKNDISSENSIIFTAPLHNIMKFGKPYLVKYKYQLWDNHIISLLDKYKKYYPFTQNSDKKISPTELTKTFGSKGKFWETVNEDMYGIFEYKDGQWQSRIPNLFGKNTASMLNTLNNTQKFTDTLWDKSGKLKPIDIKVSIMPIPNNLLQNNTFVKMTLLSIGNQKSMGISTEQKSIILRYNWFEEQPSSVGFIDSNEQINSIETHSEYWSLFDLLNQANKDGDVYTWNQNNIAIKFKIDFDNIFETFDN